jgi:hypothetical protein
MQDIRALSRKRTRLGRGQGSSFSQRMVLIIVPDMVCDNMVTCLLALLLVDMEWHLISIQGFYLPTVALPGPGQRAVSQGMLPDRRGRSLSLSNTIVLSTIIWYRLASGAMSSSHFWTISWVLVWEERSLSP